MTIRSLLIINRFLPLKEFSRNVKEKAIPKINRPGNWRKIFWINVLSNILSMAKGEITENPARVMWVLLNLFRPESSFLFLFFVVFVLCSCSLSQSVRYKFKSLKTVFNYYTLLTIKYIRNVT